MKTKTILSFVFFLLASISLSAQTSENLKQEFEKSLKEKGVQIETITSKFTQTRSMSILSNKIIKHGDFYYSRPEKILLSFDDGDYIKMGSKSFSMRNAGKTIKTKISANPMLKELNKLLSACMTGEIIKATTGFNINLEDSSEKYILRLTPIKQNFSSKLKRIIMIFNKKEMSLVQLKMEENSGDFTSYDFTDKIFNSVINQNLFK